MNWLFFLLGFLAFPAIALVIFLFILWRTKQIVVPKSFEEAQDEIRELLTERRDGDSIQIRDEAANAIVRVSKRDRKTKPPTLDVEIRCSETKTELYEGIRSRIRDSGLDFEEQFTSKRRKPKLLRFRWPDGGPLVVAAVSRIVKIVFPRESARFHVLRSDRWRPEDIRSSVDAQDSGE